MVSWSVVGARRSFAMACSFAMALQTLFEAKRSFAEVHVARLGLDRVLLWPHALVG